MADRLLKKKLMADLIIPVLPDEIIIKILLKVPPKSLSKLKCVSKSWLELISSPKFVKDHWKLTANDREYRHHWVIFQETRSNFKVCSDLPSLFYKGRRRTELFDIGSPMGYPIIYTWIVGSVNGLICVRGKTQEKEPVLWNPTIKKSKKLPSFGSKLRKDCACYCYYGYGYDESHDDYKMVVIQCIFEDSGLYDTVVNIYSLRADSWRTINKFQGNFLVNSPGKFVDGKLYWALSADIDTSNMCNIISLDLADETWRRLELPDSYGKGSYPFGLGVVGSHLSVLNCLEFLRSDVWIMKDCEVEVSWTKIFTIDHPKNLGQFISCTSIFSVPHYQSNEDKILLLLPSIITKYDGSTRQLEVADQFKKFVAAELYVESLVDPLLISQNLTII